ncbi:probable G-protein coupled receptor 139 [Scyliorhinus canicula]|uniref:probable G-protein coupled receptor 139 n=1 Tax=Scyliorhinus canicula TaxID=7830 RepID=UPI0018F63B48|nr:probable G-protein coupled receptor 139 [Scyliorhinus canicula]
MDEEHWMVKLQKVFYPLLAVIGIPSNIVAFLIFWQRNCMVSKSSTYYLMAISVADTLVLLLIVIIELVLRFHILEPFWMRDPWCTIRDILNYGAYNASVWLVVTFTVERFIAISGFRLKAKLCTSRCAIMVITLTFVLSYLLAIPYFWSNHSQMRQIYNNVTETLEIRYVCIYKRKISHFFVHGLVWFQTILDYIIPFIIIFTLNGLTLRLIVRSNKVHHSSKVKGMGNSASYLHFRAQKRKSVLLLITISMSFALLCATRLVTQLILRIAYYDIDRADYSQTINVVADIGSMLDLTNMAINMYLYACTQSKFRKELLYCANAMLCPCKRCKHMHADSPTAIYQL